MDELLKHWPLVIIPTALYCAIMLAGTRKLEATYQTLGGRITSEEDLAVMKRAINANMKMAVVIFGFIGLYICLMFYLSFTGYVTLLTTALYIPLLTTSGLVVSLLYAKKVEARAKDMVVTAENPQVLQTYRLWVKQWDLLRLKLPE